MDGVLPILFGDDNMINWNNLNGQIVSRETLERLIRTDEITEAHPVGQTMCLTRYRLSHVNGNDYTLYIRGGYIRGKKR